MKRLGLACALLGLACRTPDAPPSTPSAQPRASVAFVEKGGGILQWDFAVRGLPATDPKTGAIVVADVSHGRIASSLALSIRWLRPGQKEPLRTLTVLDDSDASHVLYEVDPPDDATETSKLAASVRARVREANGILAAAELRPTIACTLQSTDAARGCVHPQRLTCGALAFELRGDTLSWRAGAQTGSKDLAWRVAPMTIGEGPPKDMVTCFEEAHLDPVAMWLAGRVETSCKGGGGDACYLSDEWRAMALK